MNEPGSMRLQELLSGLDHHLIRGGLDQKVTGLACDSRKVGPGYVFVALKGYQEDGHVFIKNAVENGAVAIVAEAFDLAMDTKRTPAMVQVTNSRKALPKLAANYFGHPYARMNLIGITGTNGKTSTSYLLESILHESGALPGVIGTINYRARGHMWAAATTTPGPLELMETLRRMADSGVSDVVMEVSSHALDQGRVEGCAFRAAVFTNLSRDHLDYHGSMEEYFKAKSLLFRNLTDGNGRNEAMAVINLDDPRGKDLISLTRAPVITYGLQPDSRVRAKEIQSTRTGLTAKLETPAGTIRIHSSLIGEFNIYNIMAAAATALCLNIPPAVIESGIASIRGVPGRFERIDNKGSLTVIVDYAHTPDALLKALSAMSSLARGGRIISIFGCGGDRDKGKRREMGKVAGENSDLVVLTSDNPRSEDPLAILSQIEEGVQDCGMKRLNDLPFDRSSGPGYILEPDRRQAIHKAIQAADTSDLILIAGKGHEDYQIIGKDKRHFDDREVVAELADLKYR